VLKKVPVVRGSVCWFTKSLFLENCFGAFDFGELIPEIIIEDQMEVLESNRSMYKKVESGLVVRM
jgi:hypothetical protein